MWNFKEQAFEIKNEIRISQKYKKDFLQIFRQYLLPYKKNHNH